MLKVMIVDDLEVMRRQIKRLKLWGENTGFYIADEAEDGQTALDKLQKEPVDLLITDIKMPRINGMELLKETYEKKLATCVVFLSEYGEFTLAKEALQYDIFDYLVKPVKEKELRVLLKKAKEYIREKEASQRQLEKLEDKLMDKMEIYYPEKRIASIIEYLASGNKKAVEITEAMTEEIAMAMEYDMIKVRVVLERACDEIWTGVKKSHGWLEDFMDTSYFSNYRLAHHKNLESIKKEVTDTIRLLQITLGRFILRGKTNVVVQQICTYVIQNVENKITMNDISESLYLSKNYIGDIFKEETGVTVGEYITGIKMERAKRLIVEGELKNYEIAEKLAYKDVEYFSKLFKKTTGQTPKEFKKTSCHR